jgi:TRAP-type C4-dicarboxylate transport system permease small subunit
VFGACWCSKVDDHVSFNLIYVKLGKKGRAIMDIAGCLIVLTAFVILLVPSWDYILFMGIKSTPVLKLKFSLLYAPFMFFLFFSICYAIRNIVLAAQVLLENSADNTRREKPL